jgi:plasmid stabilization system protein ParE
MEIVIHRRADADLREALRYARKRAPETAARWFTRFQDSIRTLLVRPERCPLAREASRVGIDLREHHFGRRPYVHRVLFVIDGEKIRIVRVRRGQRRDVTPKMIRDSLDRP